MIISLDTETTGLDWAHGAKPFLVTYYEKDTPAPCFWEWPVDPLTREPQIPPHHLIEIAQLLDDAEIIYMQGGKFDAHALDSIGLELPWHKVRDTICMGHLLASNHSHTLTNMCIEYLGRDIGKYEEDIKSITQSCRAIVKKEYPQWKIAREGQDGMPSVSESSDRDEDKPWKNDMWLARALIEHGCRQFIPEHWGTVCQMYANSDSFFTLQLGLKMESLVKERGLWNIFLHRMELPRVAYEMEKTRITLIGDFTNSTIEEYQKYIESSANELCAIAAKYEYDLNLAKGAALNDNMREFFYGSVRQKCPECKYEKTVKHWNGVDQFDLICPKCSKRKRNPRSPNLKTIQRNTLNLEPIPNPKSGNTSLDKNVMQEYLTTLDDESALEFIRLLMSKRRHDTDLSYMEAYRRFWIPLKDKSGQIVPGYYEVQSSFNPFGTDHLRQSSSNPNLQNVSTQEDDEEEEGQAKRLSVRRCFGPAPGREWWSMDYKNLEKRIPAYEANEPKLIEIFEKPNEPPYWGSDHSLIASLLFPDEFYQKVCPKCLNIPNNKCINCQPKIPLCNIEGGFKKKHLQKNKKSKNTNFAKQYGAGKRKVETTSGVIGAFELIDRGLPELARLQKYYLREAEKTGWVTTLPDRTVDPTRGYPILASRTDEGRVLSTTPFNYHVSGTACWCKNIAMIKCSMQCKTWRKKGFDARMPLEGHDSLLFDFPKGKTPQENLPRIRILQKLMEQSGDNLIPRIPTPVSIDYHDSNWAEEVAY